MSLSTPRSLTDNAWESFSRSTTLNDVNGLPCCYPLVPSPQAWLANSKRRSMPSFLNPPGSPIELVLPITHALDERQWNKRLSLLTHQYLGECGASREDQILDKAWKTLELFCVSDQAKDSLQRFKAAQYDRSSTPSFTPNNSHDRYPSWLKFPSFLDDSFNSTHNNFSIANESTWDPMMEKHSNRSRIQDSGHANGRGQFQSPLQDINQTRFDMADRLQPRYMTPTTASRAQAITPDIPVSTLDPNQSTGKGKGRAWMLSAAKRVGIGSSTPRSKKEGRFHKLVSPKKDADESPFEHPYKMKNQSLGQGSYVSTPSGESYQGPMTEMVVNSSNPVKTRGNGTEKPLPSLPIATLKSTSPVIRRSLLDAVDRPLRRSVSPSAGKVNHSLKLDWPTLSPSRPGTPILSSYKGKELLRPAVSKSQPSPITSIGIFDQADDSLENMSMISRHSAEMLSPGESVVPLLGTLNDDDEDPKDMQVPRCTVTPAPRNPMPCAFPNNNSQEALDSRDDSGTESSNESTASVKQGPLHASSSTDQDRSKRTRQLISRIPKRLSNGISDGLATPKDERSLASRIPQFSIPRRAVSGQSPSNNVESASKPISSALKRSLPRDMRLDGKTRIPIALRSPLHVDREGETQVTKTDRSILNRMQLSRRASWSSSGSDSLISEPKDISQLPEESTKDVKRSEDMYKITESSAGPSSPLVLPSFSPIRVPNTAGSSSYSDSFEKPTKEDKPIQDYGEPLKRPRNEHIDRVKRLSLVSPDYGPVLRVSDSAERVIMGSPESAKESPADKRISAPNFQRPPKAAGKMTNRRSLGQMDPTEVKSNRDSRSSKAASYHESFSQLAVYPSDPFISSDSPKTDKIPRVASDWPLRRTSTKKPIKPFSKVDYSEEKKPWIPPPTMILGEPKTSIGAATHYPFVPNRPLSFRKSSQTGPHTSRPNSITAIKSHAIGERQQFPPRVSSRTVPVVPITTRAEFEAIRGRGIPNRFESSRPKHKPIITGVQVTPAQNGNAAITPPKPAVPQSAAKTNSTGGKKILSNFRDLFHKKSSPDVSSAVKLAPAPHGKLNSAPIRGRPGAARTLSVKSSQRNSVASPELIRRPADAFAHPPKKTVADHELRDIFPDAMNQGRPDLHAVVKLSNRILDLARAEPNPVKQERLMTMAIILVDTVSSARDAEKCVEEAKQAVARAEKHALAAKKAVVDLVALVEKDLAED